MQRLLIAMQRQTYVRPHKHSEQWKIRVLHRSRWVVVRFSEAGELLARYGMSSAAPVIQSPPGIWRDA